MLETSNLTRKYTPICSFRKYTLQCLDPLNFADVNNFFCKKLTIFFPKKYLYSKRQCESCVRDFLVLLSVFLRQFLQSLCPESGLWTAPNWPEIRKKTMTSQFSDMASPSNFLTLFCFSCEVQLLVEVSCQCRHWFWNDDNFLL